MYKQDKWWLSSYLARACSQILRWFLRWVGTLSMSKLCLSISSRAFSSSWHFFISLTHVRYSRIGWAARLSLYFSWVFLVPYQISKMTGWIMNSMICLPSLDWPGQHPGRHPCCWPCTAWWCQRDSNCDEISPWTPQAPTRKDPAWDPSSWATSASLSPFLPASWETPFCDRTQTQTN